MFAQDELAQRPVEEPEDERPDPLARLPAQHRGGRDSAYLRVFFLWLVEPDDAAAYVRALAEHHRTTLARYEAAAGGGSPTTDRERASRIALEAGIRHERALLGWAEWALGELEPSV
jgi:hypothetical protein